MSTIKCLRLVTGEDVMGDVECVDGIVTITNPIQVTMVPNRGGSNQPNFGFIPFPLVSNDKVILIGSNHIVFTCEPAEEFLNQYNSIYGGIITPSKRIII